MFIDKNSSLSFAAGFTCLAASVRAHPGHGQTDGDSLMHHLFEPMHAWPVWLVIVSLSLVAAWWLRRSRRRGVYGRRHDLGRVADERDT